ncbi:MAG TPA: hypothetical protein VGN31_08265, partial [Paraburkholderia sp.]
QMTAMARLPGMHAWPAWSHAALQPHQRVSFNVGSRHFIPGVRRYPLTYGPCVSFHLYEHRVGDICKLKVKHESGSTTA